MSVHKAESSSALAGTVAGVISGIGGRMPFRRRTGGRRHSPLILRAPSMPALGYTMPTPFSSQGSTQPPTGDIPAPTRGALRRCRTAKPSPSATYSTTGSCAMTSPAMPSHRNRVVFHTNGHGGQPYGLAVDPMTGRSTSEARSAAASRCRRHRSRRYTRKRPPSIRRAALQARRRGIQLASRSQLMGPFTSLT